MLEWVERTHVDLVIPMTDVTMYLIALHKKEFIRYTKLTIPEFEAFEFVSDKWTLLKHAEQIGILVKDRVVADVAIANQAKHLWPDAFMILLVFLESFGFDSQHHSVALHRERLLIGDLA